MAIPSSIRWILVASLAATLGACSDTHLPFVYHPPKQQGNIIDTAAMKKLHKGMSMQQVQHLMGSPIIRHSFRPNQWIYVYTNQRYRQPIVEKKIILTFAQGQLSHIDKS